MMPTDSRLVRLFLGIFCRPNQYAHRALIRATMLSFAPSAPGAFDHRFYLRMHTHARMRECMRTPTQTRQLKCTGLV